MRDISTIGIEEAMVVCPLDAMGSVLYMLAAGQASAYSSN